ncbi:TIGR04255 family protein [Streptomyces sp. S063]|uniref:TIGR04255 family protein n=1 Tax=Streptomyces sp. S063 TaxID=2005885 RepID=UPI0013E3471A|nr:TIGR04255 family protein [Streptomyces sp. S063]
MYENREIYPNSPLALVTVEVKYPYAPRLRQVDALDRIQMSLEGLLPIRQREQRFTLQVAMGAGPLASPPQAMDVFRFLNKSRRRSAVISPEAFSVEMTDYREFSEFLELISAVAQAIQAEGAIPAVERIGLRYIDEIRVPEKITEASQWSNWLAPELLPSTESRAGTARAVQGAILYETAPSSQLRLSFASLEGQGVVSNDPLRRKSIPEPGPFFVIDIDSFWEAASPEDSQEFDVELLKQTVGELHDPMGRVFQSVITDKLREIFRGENG